MKKLKGFMYGVLFLFPLIVNLIMALNHNFMFNKQDFFQDLSEFYVEPIYNALIDIDFINNFTNSQLGDITISYFSYCVLVLFIIAISELIFLFINAFKRKGAL